MWSFPGAFDKLRIWWNRQSIINQVPKKLYSCGTQLQSAASQSADSRWTRHRRARVTLRHISSLELYEHVNFTLSIFLACKALSFLFFFFIFHIFLSHANHPLPTVQWALRMRPVVNDSGGAGATLVFVTCQHDVCCWFHLWLKVSMVCQLESLYIEGSEEKKGYLNSGHVYNKVN